MKINPIVWLDLQNGLKANAQTILGNVVIMRDLNNQIIIAAFTKGHYQSLINRSRNYKTMDDAKKTVQNYCEQYLKDISFYLE